MPSQKISEGCNRVPGADRLQTVPYPPRHTQPLASTRRSLLPHGLPVPPLPTEEEESSAAPRAPYNILIPYPPTERQWPARLFIGLKMGASVLAIVAVLVLASHFIPRSAPVPSVPSAASLPGNPHEAPRRSLASPITAGSGGAEAPIVARSEGDPPGSLRHKRAEQKLTRSHGDKAGERLGTKAESGPALAAGAGNDRIATRLVEEERSRTAVESARRFVHPHAGYAITPPPGFTLVRSGQRTVWRGPEGTQLLVETTSAPGRSARGGWEELHRVLAKKYGRRYRLHGITDTTLAGQPAAAWEFELATEQGALRKIDIAVLDRGVGYGVLVSAPAERFAVWWPQFTTALHSFRLPLADFPRAGESASAKSTRLRPGTRRSGGEDNADRAPAGTVF